MSHPQVQSWERHAADWRDPAQITSQWREAHAMNSKLLAFHVRGDWWDILKSLGITLLVTREYEHLIVALNHDGDKPIISFQPMPHPSGLTVDRKKGVAYVASTRNPNQVIAFEPATGHMVRRDASPESFSLDRPLVPICTRYYPGCMYLHDLSMIGDALYANAVAHNAVVCLEGDGAYERTWWPRCIDTEAGPDFSQNYLQLNSIAAGTTLAESFFSASGDRISRRRPGHKNFPVDRRGVIFSGSTREPVVRGLTRPHSARLYQGRLWVDNSGYAEFGCVEEDRFSPLATLPGWTRGLCFSEKVAFVGTSRIIPRFRQYAPGIAPQRCVCGVHAVDIASGRVMGSLIWPHGNQVFAVDWIAATFSGGFPFRAARTRGSTLEQQLFYSFETQTVKDRAFGRNHL